MTTNHLLTRIVTGFVGSALLLLLLFKLPPSAFILLCLFAAFLAWWEWLATPRKFRHLDLKLPSQRMLLSGPLCKPVIRFLFFAIGCFLLWVAIFQRGLFIPFSLQLIWALGLMFLTLAIIRKLIIDPQETPASYYIIHLIFLVGGFIYISLSFMYLIKIYQYPSQHTPAWNILKFLIIIWGSDVFAYFSGKLWGKHKLSKMLSPHKSCQGLAAAMIWSSAIFSFLFYKQQSLWALIVIGLVLGFLALCGDLFESSIKRGLGIKDLGAIIPGHGGILDRIDAFLFTAPFYFLMLHFGVIIG